MNKINFVNGQAPYINDKNLNQIQYNMEAVSVPPGGTKGQILEKKSNEDNDIGWVDNTGGVTGDTLPVGSVVEFASDTNIPENWLLCNGQEVNRTEYDLLFAVIGTTWGAGDGKTTFNVPTKEGLVTVGKKASDTDFNTLGKTGGEKKHTLTVDEMPSHDHAIRHVATSDEGRNYRSYERTITDNTTGDTYRATIDTNLNGGDQPHNNLPPYVTSNYIIKAKQSAGVVATVVDSLESESATDALSAKQGKVLNEKIEQKITTGEEFATNEWIDGKQVFRKRIDCGNLSNGGTKKINHNITFSEIVRVECMCNDGTYYQPIPYVSLGTLGDMATHSIGFCLDPTQIIIVTNRDMSVFKAYVDLYYTKN